MIKMEPWMVTATCLSCGRVGTIRAILYGFPDMESALDEDVIIGGCCVSGNDPEYSCKECGWNCNFDPETNQITGHFD